MVVKYTGPVTFIIIIFFFSGSRPVETREPILTHDSSKDAVWRKEVPFGVRNTTFRNMGVFCPQNTPKMAWNRDFPAKTKTSNNFETLEDRQKMSMYHDYETGSSLSESVFKNLAGRPLAEIH